MPANDGPGRQLALEAATQAYEQARELFSGPLGAEAIRANEQAVALNKLSHVKAAVERGGAVIADGYPRPAKDTETSQAIADREDVVFLLPALPGHQVLVRRLTGAWGAPLPRTLDPLDRQPCRIEIYSLHQNASHHSPTGAPSNLPTTFDYPGFGLVEITTHTISGESVGGQFRSDINPTIVPMAANFFDAAAEKSRLSS